MNNNVACVLAFIVGAAAGAAISWKLLKDRYEQISREEAEAFRKAISERKKSQNEEIKDSEDDTESDIDENDHIEKGGFFCIFHLLKDSSRNWSIMALDSGATMEATACPF